MKYLISIFLTATVLLSGCASVIRTEVTAFHAWPADVPDTSYVFERTKAQDDSLEYRSYENLVRNTVRGVGLQEANAAKKPSLKITFDYGQQIVDVRTIEPVVVDPYFYGSGFYGGGFYGRGPYRRGFYGGPFIGYGIDPFYWGPPLVRYQDVSYPVSHRQLHLLISRYTDSKSVYEVTVRSQGQNPSLAAVMPYMVRSAFSNFPGQSGVTRTIDMKMEQ